MLRDMWFLRPKPSDYSDKCKDLWLSLFSREITSCKSNRSRHMMLVETYYSTQMTDGCKWWGFRCKRFPRVKFGQLGET